MIQMNDAMAQWTYSQVKAAADYLAPMASRTRFNLIVRDDQDMTVVCDNLAEQFPNAVHVGFGGQVSRGRLADALPDEVIDPEVPQTIIIEAYSPYGSAYNMFLDSILTREPKNGTAPHSNTVVIMVSRTRRLAPCVSFGIK